MDERKVAVFFYGSYMNQRVLAEVGLAPESWEQASLAGFDIRIAPRANLIAAPGQTVYGVLATALTRSSSGSTPMRTTSSARPTYSTRSSCRPYRERRTPLSATSRPG